MQRTLPRGLFQLVEVLRRLDPDDTSERLSRVSEADVDAVLFSAREHGVEAWIAETAPTGSPVWLALQDQRRRFVAARLRNERAIADFGALMYRLGRPWAVLKGLALGHTIYPRPQLRYGLDLDLLVSPGSLSDLVEELLAHGYELQDRNWPLLARIRPGELKFLSPHGVVIDLHWSLYNSPRLRHTFGSSTDALLARRRVLGSGLAALSEVDQLSHVVTHASLSGANRLGWLVDTALAVRSQPDWATAVSGVRANGAGPALCVMLDRCRRVFDVALPTSRGLAGPAWTVPVAWANRRQPLRDDYEKPGVARSLARSVCPTVAGSLFEFGRHGLSWVGHGAHRDFVTPAWRDPSRPESAAFAVDDDGARSRFFQSVAKEFESTGVSVPGARTEQPAPPPALAPRHSGSATPEPDAP